MATATTVNRYALKVVFGCNNGCVALWSLCCSIVVYASDQRKSHWWIKSTSSCLRLWEHGQSQPRCSYQLYWRYLLAVLKQEQCILGQKHAQARQSAAHVTQCNKSSITNAAYQPWPLLLYGPRQSGLWHRLHILPTEFQNKLLHSRGQARNRGRSAAPQRAARHADGSALGSAYLCSLRSAPLALRDCMQQAGIPQG